MAAVEFSDTARVLFAALRPDLQDYLGPQLVATIGAEPYKHGRAINDADTRRRVITYGNVWIRYVVRDEEPYVLITDIGRLPT